MKPEEAIDRIKEYIATHRQYREPYPIHIAEALQMGFDALEKQIPMKTLPYEMGLDGKIEIPCGNCGSSLDGIWNYCPFCGQEILWRAKDDTGRSD